MREELKELGNAERHTFTATFERYGMKSGYKGPVRTVLLRNVKLDGKILCDHLWFNLTKGFEQCNLATGDIVQFDGRVTTYEKGYKGRKAEFLPHIIETDYKIERPTKVKVVGQDKDYLLEELYTDVPF